jgi:hypothetical protein
LLAGNGVDLPKGHIPIREIKRTQQTFQINADIEWLLTVNHEANANLIAGARNAKVIRPRRGSCVQLHAVDGQLAFERSPFEYDYGDLEWALTKNWISLSVARDGIIKISVAGMLGDYLIHLRGYATGLPTEIEMQQRMSEISEQVDRENLLQIDDAFDNYWTGDLPPPVPSDRESAPSIQEPRSEDLSPAIVEWNRAAVLDAILDAVLPPGDGRHGAFFGAVEQVKAMGGAIDEQVLGYIRREMSDEPHRVAAIFAWDTTRQILDGAATAMTNRYPTEPSPPRELTPAPTSNVDEIILDMALNDTEMRQLTRQWGLKPFRGRAGPLDIVAYKRRCGFVKITGPRLSIDHLVTVRRKPKAFWQEQGAAERWLAEILNPSTHDDVPKDPKSKAEVKSEDGDGEPP